MQASLRLALMFPIPDLFGWNDACEENSFINLLFGRDANGFTVVGRPPNYNSNT